ncbi:MAG TPA: pitrilysin family protein [Polyangia bacterium]|nr:pitrilysin family protein [Polyangia bacterium]
MTALRRYVAALGLLLVPLVARADQGWGQTYTLPNGLRVILDPDKRFPTVTVFVRYHVGARQEPVGRSGMAHLLEHLTFKVPRPASQGGTYASQFTISSRNGSTYYENTDYYTTAPSGDLEYALWTERWRMGINLGFVAESDRQQELNVVKNERRERLEIQPYRAGEHKLWSELFPADHPFHEEVIGSMADMNAITLAEAKDFYSKHYGPANATLAVVGDFDPEAAREIIAGYYATMTGTPAPSARPVTPRSLDKEIVIRHDELYGRNPRLHIAWHAPAKYSPEHAAGEVAARMLGGTDASRLAMGVPEASLVAAYQESLLAGSVFHVIVEPRAGVSPETLLKRVDFAIDVLRTHPPSIQQVDVAVRRILRERFLIMEDSLAKARFLVDVTTGAPNAGDPMAYERQRFAGVLPEDVQRFVTKHLVADRRVVLFYTPGGGR